MQVCSNGCQLSNGKPRTASRTSAIDDGRRICRRCAAEEEALDGRTLRQRRREVALMRRARAAAAAEAGAETAAAEEAPEAGAGAEAEVEAMASASGAARGEPKNTKSCQTKKQRTSAAADNNNVFNNIDSTRRRRVRSRIDLSLFTYPGFFWVDRIPPQAGVVVEEAPPATARNSNGGNNEDNTGTFTSGKSVGEECGIDRPFSKSTTRTIASSAGDDGECASATTSGKKSKSNAASPTAGYKSPTKRLTPNKRTAKHENGNVGAARNVMKPETERTSASRSKRTRNSDQSQHTSSVSPPTTPIINIGHWRDDELERLAEGIRTHRYQWRKVAACVRTRTLNQCKVKNEELIAAQIASWPKRS